MKKLIITCILLFTALCFTVLFAQSRPTQHGHHNGAAGSSRPSFEQFMAEKTQFMLNEMKLPAADSANFVPLYQALQREKGELLKQYSETRKVYMRMRNNEPVADSLYIKAVMSDAALQVADAQLEETYLQKFSKVLSPRQLFSYQEATKKFKNSFMSNRPHRNGANARQQQTK